MPAWAVWIAIAVALGAGELSTAGFILGPVAVAAVAAAVSAGAGAPAWVQLVVFIAGSIASLALLRPLAR